MLLVKVATIFFLPPSFMPRVGWMEEGLGVGGVGGQLSPTLYLNFIFHTKIQLPRLSEITLFGWGQCDCDRVKTKSFDCKDLIGV